MPINRSGRACPKGSGGGILPTGHAVNLVIDDDRCEIKVPPGRMDKMVAANGGGITIAHDGHHLQAGFSQFHPRGKGQGPTVG